VIAFPKTAKGTCLVSGAPGLAEPRQLKELGIQSNLPKAALPTVEVQEVKK
jgi:aspartyl-tRNA synthetase